MKTTRTVNITEAHINRGKPISCTQCAGSLAILDTFPEVLAVHLMQSVISYVVTETEEFHQTKMPLELDDFVADFDFIPLYLGMVHPLEVVVPLSFSLTLDIPK